MTARAGHACRTLFDCISVYADADAHEGQLFQGRPDREESLQPCALLQSSNVKIFPTQALMHAGAKGFKAGEIVDNAAAVGIVDWRTDK